MYDINEVITHISQAVKYDSSQAPAAQGAPFGKGAADCLDYFLKLAQSFGFETKNYDNYAGEVIFGEGEEFAVLAHLDVVPAGRGWKHDPFGGEIDYVNSRIWGRGTMDDKGPAVIILHCLKQLKDEGFVPSRKIKLIVGCNEENGWECIKYYKKHAVMPKEGFSPDADFPVIYAEKGILHVELKFPANGVKHLEGGERANMVCDYCETSDNGTPIREDLTFENGKIVARGKSAHASLPHLGRNAIEPVLSYLGLNEMSSLLFDDGFGLKKLKDGTGSLTFSPNIIKCDGDNIYVTCDIRYPASYSEKDVLDAIEERRIPYTVLNSQAPLHIDPGCKLVKTLCETYCEVTGKTVKPVSIGGGTYARALECGAGFGPEEEGEESTIHKPDEYITFEKIGKCLEIYKLAIERLCR